MFTVFRMILMPFGIYHCIKSSVMTSEFNPLYRRVIGYIAIFQFTLLYLLNCYWYHLMVIRLGQLFGFIKKKDRTDDKYK
jgi:hypothetical protein